MLLNKPRAEAYLNQYNLDAVVASSPVNVNYLSEYYLWIDPLMQEFMSSPGGSNELAVNYAIFSRGGEGGAVIPAACATNLKDSWINRIGYAGPLPFDRSPLMEGSADTPETQQCWDMYTQRDCDESPEAALASLLQEMGLADGRLGVEMYGLSERRRQQLRQALPKAEVKDCSNLLRLIRMVKSEKEQQHLARSAEINERAMMKGLIGASAGTSISELIHQYRVAIAQEGASLDHYAYSIDGLGLATQGDYSLRNGDSLFIDTGCIFEQQFSDGGTTLMVGSPSDELIGYFNILKEAVDVGQAAATVGTTPSAVHKAMISVAEDHGLAAPIHGHSLGLDIREYPILLPDRGGRIRDECVDVSSDVPLEAGMIINIEAPYFFPPTGALQVEKTFIVTAQGCRGLVEQDRSAPVIV